MKIALVGWGLEAQSAYRFFGPDNEYLIVNEQPSLNFPAESEKLKLQYLKNERGYGLRGSVKDLSYLDGIEDYDKVVYQPTAFFNLQKKYGDDKAFWDKATTVYDIFFENHPTSNIIGVTGSKGKGTTSTLIHNFLKAGGQTVYLGGNIGTPILDLLPKIKPDDWLVWELANFQLKAASYSPHIAVCLMIVPEHLEWHPDLDDYVEAKGNIFRYQSAEDIAVYFAENEFSAKIANYSPGKKIPYYKQPGARIRADGMIVVGEPETEIINKSHLKLPGEHNLQNICAAVTAFWQISQNVDAIKQVLASFSGLEHRLELVRELKGVKFYNDSFAAAVTAPVAAIEAIKGKKIMVVGGYERNLDLSPLAVAFSKNKTDIKKAVLIGQMGPRLAQAFDNAGFKDYEVIEDKNMAAIVAKALAAAAPGDSIILSPGAASFDMYENFEVRGQKFKEAVNAL